MGTASCLAQIVLDSAHFHPVEVPDPSTLESLVGHASARSGDWARGGPAPWPWPLPGSSLSPVMRVGKGPPHSPQRMEVGPVKGGDVLDTGLLHQPCIGVAPEVDTVSAPRKRGSPSPQRIRCEEPLGDGDPCLVSLPPWDPGWRPVGSLDPNAWYRDGSMELAPPSEELPKRSYRARSSGSELDGPGAEEIKDGYEDCGVDGTDAGDTSGYAEGAKGGYEDCVADGADGDAAAGLEGRAGPAEDKGAHSGGCMEVGGKGAPGGGPEDPFSGKGDTRVAARKRCGDDLGEGGQQNTKRMRVVSYPD